MKEDFLKQFQQRNSSREPEWIGRFRREAMERFAKGGFPTTKEENWKYTSVEPVTREAFAMGAQAHPVSSAVLDPYLFDSSARLVFVNGCFSEKLSSPLNQAGVWAGSLRERMENASEQVEPYLSTPSEKAFVNLNAAFLQDGVFVRLSRGTVLSKPIQLVFYSTSNGQPVASHPRNIIVAEEGAQASIVETYISDGAKPTLTNAVTEVFAGEGSLIEHCKLQNENEGAFHFSSLHARQASRSRFDSHIFTFGAALSRNDVSTSLDQEGAECTLNGLYVISGRQHTDSHTSIDHQRPHGTSRELYKGILDGQSTAVFDGKIVVRPDAQKTNARQVNRNLLLSREALVNTRPLLEIFADDVKCNHGATIGRLDEKQIFYLRSRGLGLEEARGLLTAAFANEVVGGIRFEPVKRQVNGILFRRLGRSPLREVLS